MLAVSQLAIFSSLVAVSARTSSNAMFAEAFLWFGVVLLLLTLLFHKSLLQFIRIFNFKKTLKGPKLSEIIANSKRERGCLMFFYLYLLHNYKMWNISTFSCHSLSLQMCSKVRLALCPVALHKLLGHHHRPWGCENRSLQPGTAVQVGKLCVGGQLAGRWPTYCGRTQVAAC